MPLFQPPVTPLPDGINLAGQTAIVTGATSGIGLALARQLLSLGASPVILAVRDVPKGEAVRQTLLSDPSVLSLSHGPVVEVMKLDAEDYASVKTFTEAFKAKYTHLHIAMLNAGVPGLRRRVAPTGHEATVQVNYLSNVLLTLELLPVLEATARETGRAGRIAWTGSRMVEKTSLAGKTTVREGGSLLGHLDDEANFVGMARYADSKLLGFLFLRELARLYGAGAAEEEEGKRQQQRVIVNAFCPGMVDTNMSNVLPQPFRLIADAVKAVRARRPEVAGWVGLHAVAVAGGETHGKTLGDKEIWEPEGFAVSDESWRLQRMLWDETVDEMKRLTSVPEWMGKVGN
ncbi:hypothetical protein CABS01_08386 [Colletotrichum abscissum]|uniref:Short-chain dehydrogenase reductase family n=1 Tax=Colletotrichum abscissum TaxID=1671311 RepID=A0A9Q0B1T9_9PEZI|nr:uncharacterized protein CABS01_08386 [Colletotrichum abscissum]KAI3549195.1 hypothetical protein CABS02_08023 [Colletotrichum abscissum]KAK1507206.1 hypothetical protein CABS01_08386 [Colletotrichum abscissum]